MADTLSFLKKKLTLEQANREIQVVRDAIVTAISPRAILLFGSFARGDMTDQSDIDLIVLIDDADDVNRSRKIVARLRPITMIPLDILWMSLSDYKRKRAAGGVTQIASEEGKFIFGDDR